MQVPVHSSRSLGAQLHLAQRVVQPAGIRDQVIVSSAGGDHAVVQHEDAVRVPHGAEPVCDHNACAA